MEQRAHVLLPITHRCWEIFDGCRFNIACGIKRAIFRELTDFVGYCFVGVVSLFGAFLRYALNSASVSLIIVAISWTDTS